MDDESLLPLLDYINRSEQGDSRLTKPAPTRRQGPPRRAALPMATCAKLEKGIAISGIFRSIDTRDRHDELADDEDEDDDLDKADTASPMVSYTRGIEIRVRSGNARYLITSTYQLGSNDLAVFLAILGEAGLVETRNRRRVQTAETKSRTRAPERLLKGGTIPDAEREQAAALVRATGDERRLQPRYRFNTTCYSLLVDAGLPTGSRDYQRVRASLRRLSRVRYSTLSAVQANHPRETDGENLLWYDIDGVDEGVTIHLGAEATRILCGLGGYAYIDLNEVRRLRNAQRILYVNLCGHLREGAADSFDLDTIATMIYGPPVDPPTGRGRAARDLKRAANRASVHKTRARACLLRLVETLPQWKASPVVGVPGSFWVERLLAKSTEG